MFGIDYGNTKVDFDINSTQLLDPRFHSFSGAFTHSFLEWSAFPAALFTLFLALIHFQIKRDPATPLIAIALFSAGLMDVFHILVATRLFSADAPGANLIPFTWALCRLFNSIICLSGVSLFLYRGKYSFKGNVKTIIALSLFFMVMAFTTIITCAHSYELPQTHFRML